MKNTYRIFYSGDAFGDNLFSAYITKTLQANGYNALLDNPRISHLVECPEFDESILDRGFIQSFDCVRKNRTGLQTSTKFNVYSDLITEFKKKFKIESDIKLHGNHIPVKFNKLDNIPSYDIILVTDTGYWTLYRKWPYFNELKELFEKNDISYLDVNEADIKDNTLLNYVDKAKLYVGLETGASHYVSRFANGKSLIIQSGYTDFSYWAEVYEYECLSVNIKCSPCWKRNGCEHHKCMSNLSVDKVFNQVFKRLKYDM